MPKLKVRIASEQTRRKCATYGCEKTAVAVRIVSQKAKAGGVPPHTGFYPVCEECRDRKTKTLPGQTVSYRPIK